MLLAIPLTAAIDPELFRPHGDVIREALRHADISLEKAAQWMELDKSQLRRQLDGIEHLSAKRLLLLPSRFWQWYAMLVAERYGLPPEVQRAAKLMLGIAGRKRMARMPVPAERQSA